MVATSVAGRGLDVKDLVLVVRSRALFCSAPCCSLASALSLACSFVPSHVLLPIPFCAPPSVPNGRAQINYYTPNHIEDYVHRVGRTGRAKKKGTAYTFITHDEEQFAGDLVKALTSSKAAVPPALQTMADDFEAKVKDGSAKHHISGYTTKGYSFDGSEVDDAAMQTHLEKLQFDVEQGTCDASELTAARDEMKKARAKKGDAGGEGGAKKSSKPLSKAAALAAQLAQDSGFGMSAAAQPVVLATASELAAQLAAGAGFGVASSPAAAASATDPAKKEGVQVFTEEVRCVRRRLLLLRFLACVFVSGRRRKFAAPCPDRLSPFRPSCLLCSLRLGRDQRLPAAGALEGDEEGDAVPGAGRVRWRDYAARQLHPSWSEAAGGRAEALPPH